MRANQRHLAGFVVAKLHIELLAKLDVRCGVDSAHCFFDSSREIVAEIVVIAVFVVMAVQRHTAVALREQSAAIDGLNERFLERGLAHFDATAVSTIDRVK